MKRQFLHLATLFWLTLGSALAQPNVGGNSAVPSSPTPRLALPRRATEKPQGWTPEIETFLKSLLTTYQRAESYRDHGRIALVQRAGRAKTTTEMPMELAFRRPTRLLLVAGQYSVGCTGKLLYFAGPVLPQL